MQNKKDKNNSIIKREIPRDVQRRVREEELFNNEAEKEEGKNVEKERSVEMANNEEKVNREESRNAEDLRRRRNRCRLEILMNLVTSGCSITSSQRKREIMSMMMIICLSSR